MAVTLNAARTVAALVLLTVPVQAQTDAGPARFKDCSSCPEMVVVPGGHFMRGSPQDEPGRDLDSRNHDEDDLEGPGGKRVKVSVPAFALGVFEVTNDQFSRFVEDSGYEMPGGCISDPDGDGIWTAEQAGTWKNLGREFRGDFPAACIDWHAANAYVHWLGLRTGGTYRLPTEAEFEYALRAGSDTAYHFGDDPELLCEYGNVPDESRNAVSPELVTTACSDGFADMAPVGQFKPNAFGVHDMTGNVWEWLADCYEPSYANVPTDGTPLVKDDCGAYSIRGGSWGYDLPSLRSADRSDDPPDILFDGIGFRVVRDLLPEPDVPDWNLRVFENKTHSVSVLYPASYITVVAGTDSLFSVSSPYGLPRMDIVVTPDSPTDVVQLAATHIASIAVGKGKGAKPKPSGEETPDPTFAVGTTMLHDGVVADEVTVDWYHAESQGGLRTLAISVGGDINGRITLYLTGSQWHDWVDLTRIAHTLRVDRSM
ncbi:MAG: formylglycine-generating enzyme family protein [Gammaproteobacteria bacterium]|nr:formylglycine-generating enzyme family protein [Gammaproteobacteria bacterium]MYF27629.1 formylglycine-generating enzyme family protein [Gammaproteobacteria bacterium]MYK46183.1 formylglycine-generating enzyme family protein [Gammaproteobacteria bacterium]